MRVHLLTPNMVPGDAVSNDVLGMRRWFRRRGLETHAYAGRCHAELRKKVRPLRAYRQYLGCAEDILLYHHSVGWPAGMELYEGTRNRRMVRYHNVTPPIFYRPYNAAYVRACLSGVRETRRLARSKPELILADSEFNARDMIACGAHPSICGTVPPWHTIGALDRLRLDRKLHARLAGRTNLLFVGRVTPNKGQLHLIRALAYYRRYLRGDADLYLVGGFDAGIPNYQTELQGEIRRHGLQAFVHLTGKVSRRELKTYYASASIFLCASEHEGFCVPLIEAMYYGLPIVAYAGNAVAGTLDGSGLTWETPEPALLAESIWEIQNQPGLREMLVSTQRVRYLAHFTPQAIERRLDEVLDSRLVGGREGSRFAGNSVRVQDL